MIRAQRETDMATAQCFILAGSLFRVTRLARAIDEFAILAISFFRSSESYANRGYIVEKSSPLPRNAGWDQALRRTARGTSLPEAYFGVPFSSCPVISIGKIMHG
jgi:hypothetical protein